MKEHHTGTTTLDQPNPTAEDKYWRGEWQNRDYVDVNGYDYDTDYRSAYRYGWESRVRHADREWDDRLESDLSREWNEFKGDSRLTWEKAKHAAKDAWHRVERAMPGDFDRDGR